MDEMLARAYRDLEFDRILASLAGYAGSETAKERITSFEVEFGAGIARLSLAQTRDMLRLITGAQSFDGFEFGIMPDPERLIKQAEVGEVWGKDDIKAFRDLLDSFARVDEMTHHAEEMSLGALLDACRSWAPTDDLRKEFRHIFNSDCEVKDTASAELRRIRGKLREVEGVAASHVRGAITALGGGDEIHLSIRNQRLVINVPRGFTHRVPGIVVDTSASGASVYFEPTDLIPLNNERLELFLDEEMEVNRIVLGYEGRVARRAEEMARNFEIAVDLDFIHARARHARAMKAIEPDLDESGDTVIVGGVFPLMVGRFVPEDVSFASPHKALVVSGVNAGGKTVLLKLIGTFVLMAQVGCFVPAVSARLGVFSAVYSDIGEEQSTATDLSTFTSHLKFLRAIEERLTNASSSPALVLMDEIGTGTEPTEGASLAYAVVSHLLEKNVRLVVTTHYDLIKGMAVKFPTVKNVSLGFDLVKLEPTYKVVDGQPGLSFARQIARRFGIPESILTQAEAVLDRKDAELADIIARLADMKQAQMDALALAKAEGEKAAKITAEMDAKRKAFLADARRLKDELKLKINQLVAQTKETLRTKIEQTAKAAKPAAAVIQDVYKAVESVSDEVSEDISDALAELEIEEEVVKSTRPPVVGDLVMWRDSRVRGRVHELNEAKRTAVVLVAGKRLKANVDDLSVIEVSQKEQQVTSKLALSRETPDLDLAARDVQGISEIIDLHGMKAEEAIAALTDYFDHLPLTDFIEVRILHGVGGGILRKVTREFLMRHPLVEGFKGGVGATVVRLKKG